jgi:hypothetical protein
MARDLSTFSSVNQIASDPSTLENAVNAAAEFGKQVIETSQKAKVAEGISNSQVELMRLNQEVKTKFESNPEQARDFYTQKRRAIFEQNGKTVSPIFRNKYTQSAKNIEQNDNVAFESWVIRQSQKNTVNSVNQSIKNNLDMAFQQGYEFGESGEGDISLLLNYDNVREPLTQFASENLGSETSQELLENFDRDYVKQMIDGLSRSNPFKAAEIIESPEIKEAIGNQEDYLALKNSTQVEMFKFTQRKDFERLANEATNNIDLFEQRANGELNYLDVEKLEREDQISPALGDKLKSGLVDPEKVKLSPIEKVNIYNELFEEYERLITSSGKSKVDTIQDFVAFQEKFVEASNAGALSTSDMKKFSQVQKTLLNKFEEGSGGIVNKITFGLAGGNEYKEDPLYNSFKAINGFLSYNDFLETPENRQKLFMSSLDSVDLNELESLPETEKRKYLVGVAKDTVKNFLVDTYPELENIEELPNKIVLSDGQSVRVPYNLAEAKTTTQVKTEPIVLKDNYIDADGNTITLDQIKSLPRANGVTIEDAIQNLINQGLIK